MDCPTISRWCPEDVALSLCGSSATPEQFQEHTISYKDFCLDPSLLTNPKLVVKIDGKLYNWRVAAPMLVSLFFFHKNLPQVNCDSLFLFSLFFFF